MPQVNAHAAFSVEVLDNLWTFWKKLETFTISALFGESIHLEKVSRLT